MCIRDSTRGMLPHPPNGSNTVFPSAENNSNNCILLTVGLNKAFFIFSITHGNSNAYVKSEAFLFTFASPFLYTNTGTYFLSPNTLLL